MLTLSLCTWCRDWPPVRQASPINLALTAAVADRCEHCITDLGSRDDTAAWLRALSPRLRVFGRTLEPLHFARAYNLAAEPATGDVLAFLDADNVIGPRYVEHVLAEIEQDPLAIVHCWTGDFLDGTCGRLAMHRDLFRRIGGFDEGLGPIGHQDLDLRDRAQAAGGHVRNCNDPSVVGLAVWTANPKKLQHMGGLNYGVSNGDNLYKSKANLAAGRIVANTVA